jgi:hypothetical protein
VKVHVSSVGRIRHGRVIGKADRKKRELQSKEDPEERGELEL